MTSKLELSSEAFKVIKSGSGNVSLKINAKSTKVILSGSGTVALAGSTSHFEILLSGSGNLTSTEFEASLVNAKMSGSCKAG